VSVVTRRRTRRPVHRSPGRSSSHVKRDGTPKRSYRTQQEAAGAAQLAWTLEGVDLNTYRCELCHQWHIGRGFRDE
jgi:hypothetical protein